ncbi:glycoside hydrolase family 26 protein [Actinocorallia libanotica]|uniref:glycoside hydrolase family 26 protein n=1 Tax=Actinocorallia libanotica TaxID=46162 RepID=UPI0031D93783
MKFRYVAATALPLALVTGCSSTEGPVDAPAAQTASQDPGAHPPGRSGGQETEASRAPKGDYLGVYMEGKYKNKPVQQAKFSKQKFGRKPTIAKFFHAWPSGFPTSWAKTAYKAGALPQMEIEPHGAGTIEAIAAGRSDEYIRAYAQQVKAAGVPISISFAHEMNGYWYDWGTKKTKAGTFVKAWRRMHDLFAEEGATDVKWLWTPNVVYPMPKVKLKQYYPGNAYVDWVGVIGYYRNNQKSSTFKWIFDPTIKQIKKFSKKPILLAETGVQTGPGRDKKITDLLTTVAKRKDIIGIIWFNMDKRKAEKADYRLEANKSSVKTFRSLVTKYSFGRP